jgi:hypothetical protein
MRFVEIMSDLEIDASQQQVESCQCSTRKARAKTPKPFTEPKPIKPIKPIQPVKPVKLTKTTPKVSAKRPT